MPSTTDDDARRAARRVQLITYPNSLGGDLEALGRLLRGGLSGVFPGGVHILPPFPSSGDRGFAPIDATVIEPSFGTWVDIEVIATESPVTLDVMVNHVSRHSPQFVDFVAHGRASRWADLFITLDKVWPGGEPDPADVAKIFLRKPEHPFSDITIAATGTVERVWTSFGPRVDWSEQIDIDITSPLADELYRSWFERFAAHGVKGVRLDAIGYVVKRRGTSCFMVEPEIWLFLDRIAGIAAEFGLSILPEVHDGPGTFAAIAERGHVGYDFALPGLVLDALIGGDATDLAAWLGALPGNVVTMLDCHDGIPIQPDLVGVLPEDRLRRIVDHCVERGANVNRILAAAPGTFDAHQINITYPSACGSDDAYLLARAIQLFAPGTPQVYYVGLLAGKNDPDAVVTQGDGRAINRHDFTDAEIDAALGSPVARRQLELIELRNTHPAFAGDLTVEQPAPHLLSLRWVHGADTCELRADLAAATHELYAS
ncbi:MAG: sucrose phosphorylase [Acidimicrobiales bacterium]